MVKLIFSIGDIIKVSSLSFIFVSTSFDPRFIFIFSFSNTSAEPHLEETDLLPCFATFTPKLERRSAAAVEIFNVFFPSPPVPHVSTVPSGTFTLVAFSLKT